MGRRFARIVGLVAVPAPMAAARSGAAPAPPTDTRAAGAAGARTA
ncbi:MAG TPA: hypothetical protein VFZ79_07580 [Acidimicrobiales bacterium]